MYAGVGQRPRDDNFHSVAALNVNVGSSRRRLPAGICFTVISTSSSKDCSLNEASLGIVLPRFRQFAECVVIHPTNVERRPKNYFIAFRPMLKLDILFQQTAATPHLFVAIAESIEIQINVTQRKQKCWNAKHRWEICGKSRGVCSSFASSCR